MGRHKKANPAYRDSRPRNRCDRDYYRHSPLGVGIDEIACFVKATRGSDLKRVRVVLEGNETPILLGKLPLPFQMALILIARVRLPIPAA